MLEKFKDSWRVDTDWPARGGLPMGIGVILLYVGAVHPELSVPGIPEWLDSVTRILMVGAGATCLLYGSLLSFWPDRKEPKE